MQHKTEDSQMPDNAKSPHQDDAGDTQRPDQLARDVGLRIVEARSGLGLSQASLHTRTRLADPMKKGVSRAVLSLYETGVNKPGAREIRLLCDTLKVTPNWLLYGTESPASTMQPAQDFLRGNDLRVSLAVALAVMSLAPVDRETMKTLALSLAEKKLNDVQLAGLLTAAASMEGDLLKHMQRMTEGISAESSIDEIVRCFVADHAEGIYTNWGTLRPAIPEEELEDFDPSHPPAPRKLSDSKKS